MWRPSHVPLGAPHPVWRTPTVVGLHVRPAKKPNLVVISMTTCYGARPVGRRRATEADDGRGWRWP